MPNVPPRVIRRFWSLLENDDASDCWLWPKSVGSHGYGQIGWQTESCNYMVLTHRLAWESAVGPIPEWLTVDHVCRVKRCCNPGHLRLIGNIENATDNGQGRKTHCPQGHPYEGLNLYVDGNGHRRCRECASARKKRAAV